MKFVVIETYRQKDQSYSTLSPEYDSFIYALEEFNNCCAHPWIGSCILVDAENNVIIRQCINTDDDTRILK